MQTWAPIWPARCANRSNEVAQVQVLVKLRFVAQWYSSDSEPPGNLSARTPISLRSDAVPGESKSASQTAALMAKQRASTVRRPWAASTAMATGEGGAAGAGSAAAERSRQIAAPANRLERQWVMLPLHPTHRQPVGPASRHRYTMGAGLNGSNITLKGSTDMKKLLVPALRSE